MDGDAELLDEEEEPDPRLNQVTNAVIGAAIAVHKELGPGHAETVYEKALALEFRARGISFVEQHRFEIFYRGEVVGHGGLDFLVENLVVVELKCVESLALIHTAQVISYLRATRIKLASLINFNVTVLKDGIKRIAL